ncbi:MAG TPA: RDD family protein, partial [Pyrinomonadaceae bacterium]|nr:RDD family protein [Pyrinomonadaceae bacterium]
VAYVAEEQYQTAVETAPVEMPPAPSLGVAATEAASAPETSKTEAKTEARSAQATEAARPSSLVVVTTPPSAKTEATVEAQKVETAPEATTAPAVKTGARMVANPAQVELKIEAGHAAAARAGAQTKPRRVIPGVLDEFSLERREAQITDAANCVPVVERENDHAPRGSRFVAGVTDLLLVSLCAMPFAAIIELTSGRWSDPRVMGSMTGIVLLVMFLYFVVSTGLVGRTPAMWLFSLRAVDARSALVPTTGQSMRRTLLYMLSLATLGLGIIYALFDAEGRTVHDHLSGTIVVRE